ncbi:MAG: hypothetical protein JSW17_04315 [Candidatus Omnitrophota bacterium]|nr:MAG: hypothetical protein JSW17_04315 [Candidatus Omnitrophota bacterium]
MKLVRLYTLVAAVNVFIFSMLYIFVPQSERLFRGEDVVMENISAVLFFIGFLLSLFFVLKTKERKYRKAYFAIPIICLIGFLDEISFGARIINFTTPTFYGAEIERTHDSVDIMFRVLKDFFIHNFWLSFCVFVMVCVVILGRLKIKELGIDKAWFRKNIIRIAFLVILITGWGLYAAFGHQLIKDMYEGRSIGIFNKIIEHQDIHPLNFYLEKADGVMFMGAVLCIMLYILYDFFITYPGWRRKISEVLRAYPAFRFVLISMGLIVLSLAVDVFIFAENIFIFIEELFEINAALALVFASFSIIYKHPKASLPY